MEISILEPNVRLLEADCPLHVMPAQTVLSLPIANGDFLSIGDSANALDPLSGMGVLRALNGGILGADTLHATFEGDKSALEEYAENVEQRLSPAACPADTLLQRRTALATIKAFGSAAYRSNWRTYL